MIYKIIIDELSYKGQISWKIYSNICEKIAK